MPITRNTSNNHPNSPRSPFLIIPELISPLTCEDIVELGAFDIPDLVHGTNEKMKTVRQNAKATAVVEDMLLNHADLIDEHFGVTVASTEQAWLEWMPTNMVPDTASLPTHTLVNNTWVKIKNVDLIAVVFLSQHNTKAPFDSDFEVYGAKLEFPTFRFGFNPQIGMAVVFPAAPNFLYGNSRPHIGEGFQVVAELTCTTPFRYDPRNFPGTHKDWFRDFV